MLCIIKGQTRSTPKITGKRSNFCQTCFKLHTSSHNFLSGRWLSPGLL